MSLALQEYHERWQQNELWWEDAEVMNESCIFFETGDTPMAEGCYTLPNFGHVICYYRYWRTPSKPEPSREDSMDLSALLPGMALVEQLYGQNQPEMTDDEFDASWAATAQALDTLLATFVEQGYKPEMSTRLREIVDDSLIGFWLDEVFILPGDLDAALSFVGNPLIDEDIYESKEEARANAPAFDLGNPEHRAALSERVWQFGR